MIIGITGKPESGKTTLANFMVEQNKRYRRASFAKPLKDLMNCIRLPIDTHEEKNMTTDIVANSDHVLSGCDMRNGLLTRRGVAQFLGTELIRKRLDPDMFVSLALNTTHTDLIFDDVRFENEARTIKALGGMLIRIERNVKGSGHASEQLNYNVDEIYCNHYGLDELEKFAKQLMYKIMVD